LAVVGEKALAFTTFKGSLLRREGHINGASPHTFISYASEDSAEAAALAKHLESEAISYWMAPDSIGPGEEHAHATERAIKSCGVFLILFSEAASKSDFVANEIECCVGEKKPIFLICLDSTNPRDNKQISLFIRRRQWFDAVGGLEESHLPQIVNGVRQLLNPDGKDPLNDRDDPDSPPQSDGLPLVKKQKQVTDWGIGIEVGETKIRGCAIDLADPSARPVENHYFEAFDEPVNPSAVLDKTQEMAKQIVSDHCGDRPPVGIGIAVPGQVDVKVGTLKFGPNFFGARNVPFRTHISSTFPGVPIRVDNEIRCATRCELHLGTGRDFENFACIFIGKGVGSGMVVDRRIYFGHNYCAGEVGHIKISSAGQPCACGQIGCLETFVKAQAIVDRAKAKSLDLKTKGEKSMLPHDGTVSPEEVAMAIKAGDAAAMEVAAEVGEDLGRGIANYLNLFNPAAIVLGGGIINGFFLHMTDHIDKGVRDNALAAVANTSIVTSRYSEEGIAIGAALLFYPDDEWPF
jgi:predicted NBD/HSP70 family sugar kinase